MNFRKECRIADREARKKNVIKIGGWNCAEGATQDFQILVNDLNIALETQELDILGISEANVYSIR